MPVFYKTIFSNQPRFFEYLKSYYNAYKVKQFPVLREFKHQDKMVMLKYYSYYTFSFYWVKMKWHPK